MKTDWFGFAFSVIMAALSIWLATTQPDKAKEIDFWVGAVCYVSFVAMAGSWLSMALKDRPITFPRSG